MTPEESIQTIRAELEAGIALPKCQKCGCWVTGLSHAAYLGKKLVKAELSLQHGFKYVQDGT